MDERKGGAHKKKRGIVTLSEKHDNLLITQAERHKLNKKKIVEILIEENEEHGIVIEGWERKLNKNLSEADLIRGLEEEGRCPAFKHVNDIYHCIWARINKPPMSKKLSPDLDQALKVCLGCELTREILEGIAKSAREITNLRERVKAGVVIDIPSCIYGGQVSDDLKKLYCKNPKMTAQYRSVHNFCKTLKRGANCDGLRWSRVEAKGKFAEPEK